ncbi:hypothetical protein [Frankia sp. CcI49]|uniref:hypothetical protein n=1 Tax=Frankia sp. CcI49 TaxID=1745382 RepID=UPI001F51B27E|nr:hypothetical protein [Frankia sp. CcI49]
MKLADRGGARDDGRRHRSSVGPEDHHIADSVTPGRRPLSDTHRSHDMTLDLIGGPPQKQIVDLRTSGEVLAVTHPYAILAEECCDLVKLAMVQVMRESDDQLTARNGRL